MIPSNDVFSYHSIAVLQALSLSEVEALWELVPTDRQRIYRAAYERTRRDEGASGSDALEEALLTQLLARYADKGLVPVGAYWVPTPPQLQDAARSDTEWAPTPLETPRPGSPSPIFLVAGVVCLLVFALLLVRGISSGKPTAALKGTLTASPAALVRTVTPTPLALDAQDAIIQGGSAGGGRTVMYPVNLRVTLPDVPQPRLFVVQRRQVTTTEYGSTTIIPMWPHISSA